MSYNFCFSVSKEFPVREKVKVIFEQPSYVIVVQSCINAQVSNSGPYGNPFVGFRKIVSANY